MGTDSGTAPDSVSFSAHAEEAPTRQVRLQLVPLDALAALGVSVEPEVEVDPVAPAHVFVTSSSPSVDGVVASDVGARLAGLYRIDLARRLRRAEASGKAGEIVAVELEDDTTEQLLVMGLGDGGQSAAREAGAKLAGRIGNAEVVLCDVAATLSRASFRSFCESLLLALYRFTRKSSEPREKSLLIQLAVPSISKSQSDLDQALATVRAVYLARDLANRPSNEKNPAWLATQAKSIGKQSGVRVRVIDEVGLAKSGFGGLLAVGGGSKYPPRLVIMSYPGEIGAPRVILVGKGVTFDSGGLSIKPADGMALMKTDMSGAAAVLAVMGALRELGVTANVTGILACAENMPDGNAYRPGDVVSHFGGRTSEVFNTDAEGRLLLADALAYASLRLRSDVIVDVATLTGAATLGLSRHFGALYTADDGLASALELAGTESNDRLWRMPLVDEYRSGLESNIADLSNVARTNIGGGSISAALFLREFTSGKRWAHLDIAGPGRAEAPTAELSRGATGFGVRVLLRWLAGSPNLW